jgi:integrase/recombinase XerC
MEDLPPSGKLGLKIILDCGCRPAEVAALDVERHLDFERMTILVEKGKTHKSSRFVPMSDRVRDGIVEHLNGRTKGWLFPSNRIEGEHLQRQSFTQAFAAVRRARKLPKGTVLYLARHTFATDIMEETGNVFVAKELMGHSSTATLGRYQHPKLAGMAAAINARNIRNAEKNNSEKVTIKSQFTNCPESDAK